MAIAKTRLHASVAAFAPLNLVRDHPLASVGLALTTGLALSNMPRTRETLILALDRGLSWLLNLAISPLRLACAKAKDRDLHTPQDMT
ncbi:MAG: hypothetical protein ABSH20_19520 [Tepidisphaeraceae bacterium]